MAYEWPRMYKNEEYYENEIRDDVVRHICEYFGVDDIIDLTREQYLDVIKYRDEELSEYSVMQVGYSLALYQWEMEND
jgi:hypothetical protein